MFVLHENILCLVLFFHSVHFRLKQEMECLQGEISHLTKSPSKHPKFHNNLFTIDKNSGKSLCFRESEAANENHKSGQKVPSCSSLIEV